MSIITNTELGLKVAAWIRDHPEQYDQNQYGARCGSKHCIAGTTVLVAHGAEEYARYGENRYGEIDIHGEARDLLGLSWYEAERLFDARPYDPCCIADVYDGDDATNWRDPFAFDYHQVGQEKRHEVAAQYIEFLCEYEEPA